MGYWKIVVATLVAICLSGCPAGWFGASSRTSPGWSWDANYLPNPAVLGQPITVMGYYLDSDTRASGSTPLSTTSVHIKLAPVPGNLDYRIELGVAPLVDGRFTWTETLREAYGGATLKASGSYFLIAEFGYQLAPTGKPLAKVEVPIPLTPIATP